MFHLAVRTQMWVSDEMWEGMQKNSDNELSRRPLLAYWFMGHVIRYVSQVSRRGHVADWPDAVNQLRALILFRSDPSLLLALEAGKVFARPLEYLLRIWPCRGRYCLQSQSMRWLMSPHFLRGATDQRQRWQELRYELVEACLRAGVPPPPPTLPPSLDGVRNIMA